MANEIKDKFSASAALTITLNNLASSDSGVGRQSTIVDNSSVRYQDLIVYVKVTQGTNPTGNKGAYVYLIRSDANASQHRSDGAGASDAAWTAYNALLIGVMKNKASPSTGDVMYGEFLVNRPGPEWGIGVVHDTQVNLKAADGDHWVRYVGLNPEVQ